MGEARRRKLTGCSPQQDDRAERATQEAMALISRMVRAATHGPPHRAVDGVIMSYLAIAERLGGAVPRDEMIRTTAAFLRGAAKLPADADDAAIEPEWLLPEDHAWWERSLARAECVA